MVDAAPSVPRLASDVLRGYVVLGATVAATFALPFVIVLLLGERNRDVVVAGSLFGGWALMALVSSVLAVAVLRRASADELMRWLRATTPVSRGARVWWALNGGGAVSWAVTGSMLAIVAIVVLRFSADVRGDPVVTTAAIAVVVCSFGMIVSSYAVRYARQVAMDGGGVAFDGEDAPRFREFLYLAVQVALTFSASDVRVTSGAVRTPVTVQAVIAFVFNTVVLALLVSALIS